jgi:hypothetical protein
MEFRAANEQQQEALWRVFLMFIAMALLIIRTGLVSRGWSPSFSQSAPQDAASVLDHQPSSPSPEELYQATLVLLCLAKAVGLFVLNTREVWGTDEPAAVPASERAAEQPPICANAQANASTALIIVQFSSRPRSVAPDIDWHVL